MVKEQHPQAVKESTDRILPVWIEAFKTLLNISPLNDVENVQSWDGLAIRIEIFKVSKVQNNHGKPANVICILVKALDTIQMGFAKTLSLHINDLLNFALAHLRALVSVFNHYYLSSSATSPPGASEEERPIELPMLGCPIIDFLAVMTRGSRAKSWLSAPNVESLIVTLCGWMQMTEDDVLEFLHACHP